MAVAVVVSWVLGICRTEMVGEGGEVAVEGRREIAFLFLEPVRELPRRTGYSRDAGRGRTS